MTPVPDHRVNASGESLCGTTHGGCGATSITAAYVIWHMFDEKAGVDVGTVDY